METLLKDLRYAIRLLINRPVFTLVAVVTLALGIGVNTAVFSVVNAVLLRSLPFEAPDRLVLVTESLDGNQPKPVAYPNFLDWREQNRVFEKLAAYSTSDFSFLGSDRAERAFGEIISDDYFSLLGIAPAQGRTFNSEETSAPGRHPVAVLSDGLWKRLGGDQGVLGRTIKVNEVEFTVIGVMPEGFKGLSGEAELWVPMMMRDQLWPQTAKYSFLGNRDVHWHRVTGRLKEGVSLESAQSEMAAIGARLAQEYPRENRNRGSLVFSAKERAVGELRSPLLVLLGAVGFVLLIACANVANLMLVRTASRGKEIAIRMALGAGRSRLIRQLLTESTAVALAGGVTGLLVAVWGVDLLVSILPLNLPKFAPVSIDRGVLLFTIAVSVLTGLLLGLVPALQSSKPDLNEALKEGSRGSSVSRRSRRVLSLLVVSEIALALVLMVGAGLMIKSFRQTQAIDMGFNPDNLVMLRFDVPNQKYASEERRSVGQKILDRAAALPGIDSVAITYVDLFNWSGINRGFTVEGVEPRPQSRQDEVYFQDISPNFFATMAIPLLDGRDFTTDDDYKSQRVAVVTASFAKRYFRDESPIGRRFKYGPQDSTAPWITIVGVAGDIRHRSLRSDPAAAPVVYVPVLQSEVVIGLTVVARSVLEPALVAGAIRNEVQKFDAEMPVYGVTTARERMAEQATDTRSYALLMGLFAALALILSSVGIYGVMSYAIAERTREIGIRMALGATRRDVLRLVAKQGVALALAGVTLGLIGATLLTRLMSSLLFGVSATDPVTFIAVSLILTVVALGACFVPARRAAKVDPMVALRYE